jgi:hypothetical protein
MITPEDREAGLSMRALLRLQALGGTPPEEAKAKGKGTLTAQLERLGWKILPIPDFIVAGRFWHDPKNGTGDPAFLDFKHPQEWPIVPPEDTGLRARKVGDRMCAIRAAQRLSMFGENDAPAPAPSPEGRRPTMPQHLRSSFSTVRACEVCFAHQVRAAGGWSPPVISICRGALQPAGCRRRSARLVQILDRSVPAFPFHGAFESACERDERGE